MWNPDARNLTQAKTRAQRLFIGKEERYEWFPKSAHPSQDVLTNIYSLRTLTVGLSKNRACSAGKFQIT